MIDLSCSPKQFFLTPFPNQWHQAAEAAFAELTKRRERLLTTSYILLESGNAAARRPYRLQVDRLREELEKLGFLIWPTDADWRDAWAAYRRSEAGGAGIVDHISFQVMRRLDIRRAFTNDRHFQAAGFEILF